ncbi:pseudouridine synthase [Thalassospira sp.]|uniref:pseudouridine synthase n=1 Tax=Thalassospira sp. TaxID=1912094 RepID=UPI002732ED07|nr:pseudouridine synthase [Thalassospira sp.]MDP2699622.1 pseudouridine synthase [Thalassospira sp.]
MNDTPKTPDDALDPAPDSDFDSETDEALFTDTDSAAEEPEAIDEDAEAEELESERIAKRIARSGVCSRRDAERMISEGRVRLNGRRLDSPATTVTDADIILIDGKPLPKKEQPRLWRLFKKRGLVTSHRDEQGRETVFEHLPPYMPRVISVGRLDLNSEGLLLLTNDGELARYLELPATGWARRYRVRVHGRIDESKLAELAKGITVDGIHYGSIQAEIDVQKDSNAWMTITLREGKNREIRKVMEHLGWPVTRLMRLSYGPFHLGNLAPGDVDEITGKVMKEQLSSFFKGDTGKVSEKQSGAKIGTARAKPKRKMLPRSSNWHDESKHKQDNRGGPEAREAREARQQRDYQRDRDEARDRDRPEDDNHRDNRDYRDNNSRNEGYHSQDMRGGRDDRTPRDRRDGKTRPTAPVSSGERIVRSTPWRGNDDRDADRSSGERPTNKGRGRYGAERAERPERGDRNDRVIRQGRGDAPDRSTRDENRSRPDFSNRPARPGSKPDGRKSDGRKPDGNKPLGNKPLGSKPAGNRPLGSKPAGNKPASNKPESSKPAGGKPQGNRPAGNRSGGAAKPAAGRGGFSRGKKD